MMLVPHWLPSQSLTMGEDTQQNPLMIDPWAVNSWPLSYRILEGDLEHPRLTSVVL